MPRNTRPWKQGYRALPPHVVAQLQALPAGDAVIVGCARPIETDHLEAGLWVHARIERVGDNIDVPEAFLPPREMGRHSRWNVDGRKVALKDRPKEVVSYCWDSPNFGDYSKGSHTVCIDREVWQKETRYGKALEIDMERLADRGRDEVVFRINEPLIRSSSKFQRELLEAINLLQENVGCAEVQPAGAAAAAFAGTVHVDWELLPVGTREEMVHAAEQWVSQGGRAVPDTVRERMEVFHSLGARNMIRGTSGFSRYIGAQIEDDLVVLENPLHGNAVYVLGSDWGEVSKRSRIDLLRDETAHYDRVVHRDGWEKRLRDIVAARRHD